MKERKEAQESSLGSEAGPAAVNVCLGTLKCADFRRNFHSKTKSSKLTGIAPEPPYLCTKGFPLYPADRLFYPSQPSITGYATENSRLQQQRSTWSGAVLLSGE